MRRSLKLAALAGMALALTTAGQAQDTGAATYKAKCEHCHGADGMSHTFAGKMTHAANLRDPKVTGAADEDLIAVVTNGRKKMPAYKGKLTDDQIKNVVGYVRTIPD